MHLHRACFDWIVRVRMVFPYADHSIKEDSAGCQWRKREVHGLFPVK